MNNFKPKGGILIDINELSAYLKNFNNIEFSIVDLVNFIFNSEGGMSGGSSTVLQLYGSRDDDELIMLRFLPNNLVWVLPDSKQENEYRYEDYQNYMLNYCPDVVKNKIKWDEYGCEDPTLFFDAILSIPEEGTDSDSVVEFQDNTQCEAMWGNQLTGLYMGEDDDYLTYIGFWNIVLNDFDLRIENGKFIFNYEEISFDSFYDELSTILFDKAWNEEDDALVGVGILQKV